MYLGLILACSCRVPAGGYISKIKALYVVSRGTAAIMAHKVHFCKAGYSIVPVCKGPYWDLVLKKGAGLCAGPALAQPEFILFFFQQSVYGGS